MDPRFLLLSIALLATALAGCHEPEDVPPAGNGDSMDGDHMGDGDGMMDEPQSLTLTVRNPVTMATVGVAFNMTVDVAATHTTTSHHSGFHWSYNSTAGRTGLKGADFDGASPHVTTNVTYPGSYTIPDWTINEAGTIYVRAHVGADGKDWFGEEFTIVVQAA